MRQHTDKDPRLIQEPGYWWHLDITLVSSQRVLNNSTIHIQTYSYQFIHIQTTPYFHYPITIFELPNILKLSDSLLHHLLSGTSQGFITNIPSVLLNVLWVSIYNSCFTPNVPSVLLWIIELSQYLVIYTSFMLLLSFLSTLLLIHLYLPLD